MFLSLTAFTKAGDTRVEVSHKPVSTRTNQGRKKQTVSHIYKYICVKTEQLASGTYFLRGLSEAEFHTLPKNPQGFDDWIRVTSAEVQMAINVDAPQLMCQGRQKHRK